MRVIDGDRPEPPDDLWEKLDEARRATCPYTMEQPPGTFTRVQFSKRFQLKRTSSQDQIDKLIAAGQVERVGHIGSNTWLYRMKKQ